MSYNAAIYTEQGGATQIVGTGGKLKIDGGQLVPSTGTRASAIADATALTGGDSPSEAEHNALLAKVNSILAALRGVGVIAT